MFLILYAIVVTLVAIFFGICLYRNYLPIPDRGHRDYGVSSELAGYTLRNLLAPYLGGVRYAFSMGPVIKPAVFRDGTALIFMDEDFMVMHNASGTAISIVAKNPREVARKFAVDLKERGFTATIFDMANWKTSKNLPEGHLLVITTNALLDAQIVIRKHFLNMPVPNFM